ncbi:hypothetical protein AAZX31_13G028200 [Glycine max]|nr:hypothetical protein GLYMA_13G040750v4 [Glycine max]KAH1099731.1 hypothetical protein GYH30_035079 [Glycine max]
MILHHNPILLLISLSYTLIFHPNLPFHPLVVSPNLRQRSFDCKARHEATKVLR